MATIFYSMSGEGRGHATRVKAVVEELSGRHRIVLYAPPQAAEILEPVFAGSAVAIRHLDGLRFRYRSGGRVDYPRSLVGALEWYRGLEGRLASLVESWQDDRPDLVITDFDPVLPRVAARMGVPFVSLDHQHFLTCHPMDGLPLRLRLRAAAMAPFVDAFHRGQDLTIVSSFYRPAPSARLGRSVHAVGVLMGSDIRGCVPRDDGFLLAYLRRDPPPSVLDALAGADREVRIYGPGREGRWGNLRFRKVDRAAFVEDLARCHSLVTTAGNQLVGEAIHLAKPVLALPEPGNWEQEINGFHLERMEAGLATPMRGFDRRFLRRFLERADEFREQARLLDVCGNPEVVRLLEDHLRGCVPSDPRWRPSRRMAPVAAG